MCNAILRNHINKLQQTKPSIITTYANIPRVDRFCQFFVWLISFNSWPEKLDYTVSQTEFLTLLPTWYIKTHYTDNLCWWSSGNRRRATSAREVIEVAGSNHTIRVILSPAWGPNNFSQSMIWSWRTRSNSRTGLRAELLLPAKSAFCFYPHFYFGEEKWKLTSSFLIVINFFFFFHSTDAACLSQFLLIPNSLMDPLF